MLNLGKRRRRSPSEAEMKAAEAALCVRIGRRVRILRKRRGWTQRDLAGYIGRSLDTISNIERGKAAPGIETLMRLADLFGVGPAALMSYPDLDQIGVDRDELLADLRDQLSLLDDGQLRLAAQLVAHMRTRISDAGAFNS